MCRGLLKIFRWALGSLLILIHRPAALPENKKALLLGHRPQEWTNRLIGESAVDGIPVWIVQSMANSDAVRGQSGYAKRVNWIAKDSFISIKAEVYDEQGELLKVYHAQDIRLVDAAHRKYVPMKLEAQNVQTGHRTLIQISDYKANQNVSNASFTARYMEREQ